VIIGIVIAAVVVAIVGWQVNNRQKASSFDKLAAGAGCGKVRTVGGLSRGHKQGVAVKYSTSPPVGGDHDPAPLGPGVLTEPLSTDATTKPSIYQAVHSLEHGYVIVWYNALKPAEVETLSKAMTGEDETILVPYPQMPDNHKVALTAWGRLEYCGKPSTRVVEAFIERYRNARSAPEAINR
jgi:hypothetical protein